MRPLHATMEMEANSGQQQQQQQGKKKNNNNNKLLLLRRLYCSVKNYEWGKPCSESLVARLFAMNSGSLQVQLDHEKPYAEFWMGTHESGPSFLNVMDHHGSEITERERSGVTLKSWLLENPNVLGQRVLEKWGGDLPFLFKVCMYVMPCDPLVDIFFVHVGFFFSSIKGMHFSSSETQVLTYGKISFDLYSFLLIRKRKKVVK